MRRKRQSTSRGTMRSAIHPVFAFFFLLLETEFSLSSIENYEKQSKVVLYFPSRLKKRHKTFSFLGIAKEVYQWCRDSSAITAAKLNVFANAPVYNQPFLPFELNPDVRMFDGILRLQSRNDNFTCFFFLSFLFFFWPSFISSHTIWWWTLVALKSVFHMAFETIWTIHRLPWVFFSNGLNGLADFYPCGTPFRYFLRWSNLC